MSKGKVRVHLTLPAPLAASVARAFGRRVPALERRELVRGGQVLASGQRKVFEKK